VAEAAPATGTAARGTPCPRPLTLTRMPRTKAFAANAGSAELNAMIDRVAPSILELLADGVPRRKPAIVAALAGRYAEDEVELTLIRLAVTEQVVETGGRYALARESAQGAG
jgi:hypothetical protein